jgi:hypothetical protein
MSSYMPTKIRCGETVEFSASFSGYPATTYQLEYHLQNSSYHYQITATADGSDYDINITSGISVAWATGEYVYTAQVTDGTNAYIVESGTVEVLPSLTVAADRRSHAKKMLDAIEDLLEGRSVSDVQSYTIAGRSLSKLTIEQLLYWRDRYKSEYTQEQYRERLKRGDGVSNSIKVRFV